MTPADKPSLPLKGIGTTHFEDRTRTSFNLGVIGAFLAHRNLLEHLLIVGAGKPGTLIFEDDVYIPSDFYAKLAEAEKSLPPDWDIVFLDKYKEDGTLVNPQWMRIHKDMTAKRSWGIWSYIVRHSSLPKILAKLEHMLDVPDIQLNKFADELRMYLVRPSICRPDSLTAAQSVVTELDKQK